MDPDPQPLLIVHLSIVYYLARIRPEGHYHHQRVRGCLSCWPAILISQQGVSPTSRPPPPSSLALLSGKYRYRGTFITSVAEPEPHHFLKPEPRGQSLNRSRTRIKMIRLRSIDLQYNTTVFS
jgi:hypothetical protein